MTLKIGITPALLHQDSTRVTYNGRPLLFLERSMTTWLNNAGFLTYILSIPETGFTAYLEKVMNDLDGIVISGGADVAPQAYNEMPLRPEWSGDADRDAYELEVIRLAFENDVPVLGICRGHQLLNVAFGGTLYQDIATQTQAKIAHRDAVEYEKNHHDVVIPKASTLHDFYGVEEGRVNSVHHQSVKDLAEGFRVEARSAENNIVESILWEGDAFLRGVQWHPEFQHSHESELLKTEPLIEEFKQAILERK